MKKVIRHHLKSLVSVRPRHSNLSRYDLNGIATCAWQRVQSRTLAEQALRRQFPDAVTQAAASEPLPNTTAPSQVTTTHNPRSQTERTGHEIFDQTPKKPAPPDARKAFYAPMLEMKLRELQKQSADRTFRIIQELQ